MLNGNANDWRREENQDGSLEGEDHRGGQKTQGQWGDGREQPKGDHNKQVIASHDLNKASAKACINRRRQTPKGRHQWPY